jgi:gluconolactonase
LEANGNIWVATLRSGGITVVSPNGDVIRQVPTADPITTNVCFGGPDMRTAYVTLSGSGKLIFGSMA